MAVRPLLPLRVLACGEFSRRVMPSRGQRLSIKNFSRENRMAEKEENAAKAR